jgi:hypothetical protein
VLMARMVMHAVTSRSPAAGSAWASLSGLRSALRPAGCSSSGQSGGPQPAGAVRRSGLSLTSLNAVLATLELLYMPDSRRHRDSGRPQHNNPFIQARPPRGRARTHQGWQVPPSGASTNEMAWMPNSPLPLAKPTSTFVLPIGAAAGVSVFEVSVFLAMSSVNV